jgi:hypothetical protein
MFISFVAIGLYIDINSSDVGTVTNRVFRKHGVHLSSLVCFQTCDGGVSRKGQV